MQVGNLKRKTLTDRRKIDQGTECLIWLSLGKTEQTKTFGAPFHYYREACDNYNLGNPVSVMVMAYKAFEKLLYASVLDSNLRNRPKGNHLITASTGLAELVRMTKSLGLISKVQAEKILMLERIASPYMTYTDSTWTDKTLNDVAREANEVNEITSLFPFIFDQLHDAYVEGQMTLQR